MAKETQYRVSGKILSQDRKLESFTAVAVVRDGKVVRAAPILKDCVGHPAKWLEQYADLKQWEIEKVPLLPTDPDHG